MSKNDSQKSLLCVCALLAIGVLVASIGESMYETHKFGSDTTEGVCEVRNVTSVCQPSWGHQEVHHAISNRTSGDVALSYDDHAPLPVAPQELTIGSQTRCWTRTRAARGRLRSDADQFPSVSLEENALAAKVLLGIGSLLVVAAFILLVSSQTTEHAGDGFNKNTAVLADVKLKRKLFRLKKSVLRRNRAASLPLPQQQQLPGTSASTEDTSTRQAEDPVTSSTPWVDVPEDSQNWPGLLDDEAAGRISPFLMEPEQDEPNAGGGASSSSSQTMLGSQPENMSEPS